jgi:anti-sigma28 factor (negative regulator of flagellin synthesis)
MANKRLGIDEQGPGRPQDPNARENRTGEPPFDLLRIDCIRAALAANEYVVNPRRIADRLLEFERGLPRS